MNVYLLSLHTSSGVTRGYISMLFVCFEISTEWKTEKIIQMNVIFVEFC